MSAIKVLNMAGAEVGTVELNDSIFGIEPNTAVVHEVVKNHLANCRQGTQSALTRAEVSGGGKKPWRQKGTGHARQGSTRAPQWTHGGIVFAPKPRSYSYVLNKKVKRLAMKSALSAKAAAGEIIVIDSIKMDSIKTKDFRAFLTAVKADGKSLVVTPAKDEVIVKSARNIPVGTVIHNIEMHPGKGAQLVRSAGAYAQLMAKEGANAQIRMPSGEVRIIRTNCTACIGQVGNLEHENIQIGKAGRKRHMGWRPTVRGSVMNPCDHPHGGGEGKSPVGRPGPVTPWGKPALGYKTRKKKNPTDKFIVKRRNVK